jgi:hypothetical protein
VAVASDSVFTTVSAGSDLLGTSIQSTSIQRIGYVPPPMISALTPSARWVQPLALVMLLASATVSTYYLMHGVATERVLKTFDFGDERFDRYRSVRREWRPRVGSTLLVRAFHSTDRETMRHRIALFFAASFFALGVLYLLIDRQIGRQIGRRAAPFMILGTFLALYYANTPLAENTWQPWDMPALVLSALALLFALRQSPWLLAVTIIAAVPFKETLLVMVAFYPFFEGRSRRWGLAWAALVFALGYALRLVIEILVANPIGPNAFSYHVNADPSRMSRLEENARFLFSFELNHLAWANAGTLLILFLLPAPRPVLRGFKVAAALLYLGLFVTASFNEFRVFFEALPGGLLLLFAALHPDRPVSAERA